MTQIILFIMGALLVAASTLIALSAGDAIAPVERKVAELSARSGTQAHQLQDLTKQLQGE